VRRCGSQTIVAVCGTAGRVSTLWRFAEPGDAEQRIAALLPELPRRAIVEIVAWLGGADRAARGSRLLSALAELPAADVVAVAVAVTPAGREHGRRTAGHRDRPARHPSHRTGWTPCRPWSRPAW
jgi:hypothetical protein